MSEQRSIPVLILHGNGGASARFQSLLEYLKLYHPEIDPVIPALSGFEGRPLPEATNYWKVFMDDIARAVSHRLDDTWILYGHGIGGSMLMELAARKFTFPDGKKLKVDKVILHSAIGASLHKRAFPFFMKLRPLRSVLRTLIAAPLLRGLWQRRLFRYPDQIPAEIRKRFFEDYGRCDAFPVFFDLIHVKWYKSRLARIWDLPFDIIWGEEERVVHARYLELWKADFPYARFEVVPEWDHFPMLDQPEGFAQKFVQWVSPENVDEQLASSHRST